MKEVSSGVTGAAPIWRRILLAALDKTADKPFDVPSGIVTVDVDQVSGFRAHDGFDSRSEFFVSGNEPLGEDSVHRKVKVCKALGKIASAVDISRGDFDEKEFFYFKENDATGGKDGVNLWQKGIDEWLGTQSDNKYHPPTETCSSVDEVSVEIREPSDKSTITTSDNNVKVRAEPVTSAGVRKVEIFVDGTSKASFSGGPYEVTTFMANGLHTIKVTFEDDRGKKADREIKVGVNMAWDATPTPVPASVTPSPTATPAPFP